MYIFILSSFVMFGGQTSMTFEGFTLKRHCVYMHVSSSFTCSFFYECYVIINKIFCKHIWVGNIQVPLLIGPTRVPERGP